jgi:hypothetical protein
MTTPGKKLSTSVTMASARLDRDLGDDAGASASRFLMEKNRGVEAELLDMSAWLRVPEVDGAAVKHVRRLSGGRGEKQRARLARGLYRGECGARAEERI